MKKLERRAVVCIALAMILALGTGIFVFRYFVSGGKWASSAFNRHLYNTSGVLISGRILDRDGDILTETAEGQRTYYPNETVRKATLHAVGDLQGRIGTGALNAFAHQLTGYNVFNGAYGAAQGSDLYLTIDARYNYEAYRALGGKKGTVAVYNYKTGEILCMVSSPSYDPLAVPTDIESNGAYDGAYLNRFLSSTFTPGSVYKTVTLAAALETIPDAQNRTWLCDGSVDINGERIICSGVHGTQDLQQAFANSCNVVFAALSQEIGAETLRAQTEKSGLAGSCTVNSIPTAAGNFSWENITAGDLAWASVGQYKDQVNPCSLMVYMGAIANGGSAAQPILIQKTVNSFGLSSLPNAASQTAQLIRPDTAETVSAMLAYNVEATYGTARFPNMTLCAKSGTAEVGAEKTPHAWFAGFLQNAETPYAFVVLVENGGSGNKVAGTVAGKVLDIMVNGY